jgi:hypothetical protein
MRNISEHLDFEKLTQVNQKLYVRVLFDYRRYPLYNEDATETAQYSTVWASLLVLQEAYQQGIAAIYEATGALPIVGQQLFGFDSPCVIESISYTVFLDGVIANFDCKEDVDLESIDI